MPPPIFPAETTVQRRDAQVVEKGGVVRTRAERADAQVAHACEAPGARPALALAGAVAMRRELQALPDGHLRFRVIDVARHAVDELLQRVRALNTQVSRGRCRRS